MSPKMPWGVLKKREAFIVKSIQTVCAALLTLAMSGVLAGAAAAEVIPYQPDIVLKVGEEALIHGRRGDCGRQPRSWARMLDELPALRHGTFREGPLGERYSRRCKGLTPARGVIYRALSKGVDSFTLYGDRMKVTVE